MLYPSLTERLKNQHTSLNEIINSVQSQQLNQQPGPGKWSIHDNIAHLTVYQPVFIDRIKTILAINKPVFNAYRADDDDAFINSQKQRLNKLIEKLYADREALYWMVTNLSDNDLKRTGKHLRYGNLNIVQWTEFFLLHEAHHLFTIFKLVHSN